LLSTHVIGIAILLQPRPPPADQLASHAGAESFILETCMIDFCMVSLAGHNTYQGETFSGTLERSFVLKNQNVKIQQKALSAHKLEGLIHF
jgi:hypothetical protein